jgi:hypothetical protein
MPCKPLMCCGAADCLDTSCEGHPRNLGYESAATWPEPVDECELVGPAEAMFGAILGIVTLVFVIGGLIWLGYTLAPLFATVH